MKFVTFKRPHGSPEPGVVVGEDIVSLTGAGFADMLSLLAGGAEAKAKAAAFAAEPPADALVPVASAHLMAPVPRPPKFICVGLNYHDHAVESNMAIPKIPTIFCKWPSCVIGPGESIVLPKVSTQPDYEAEFAFIIGKGGRHIPAEKW